MYIPRQLQAINRPIFYQNGFVAKIFSDLGRKDAPDPTQQWISSSTGEPTFFCFSGLPTSSFPHRFGGTVWWEARTGCPALVMLCQPKRLPKHRGFSSQKVTVDSVDLQVYEIYELSRRRDVVWATFSFRFDNQPGVRLLSARPKALGCLVCSEKDGE